MSSHTSLSSQKLQLVLFSYQERFKIFSLDNIYFQQAVAIVISFWLTLQTTEENTLLRSERFSQTTLEIRHQSDSWIQCTISSSTWHQSKPFLEKLVRYPGLFRFKLLERTIWFLKSQLILSHESWLNCIGIIWRFIRR